jgi:hypothetical protein
MLNYYSFNQFKKFIDSIKIDLSFRLLDEFKEEYYSLEFKQCEILEPKINDNGEYCGDQPSISNEKVWEFIISGSVPEDFFKKYLSLEKILFEELDLNLKVASDKEEYDSLHLEVCNWLMDRANRIVYSSEENQFECDYKQYGDAFNKITFKERYNSNIQHFYRYLKDALLHTYSTVVENSLSPIFRSNLKWEGYDNELIELITALLENKSITLKTGKTTRKAVISQFEQIFDIKLKDAESKLSRSTERNDPDSKILTALQLAYINYVKRKVG